MRTLNGRQRSSAPFNLLAEQETTEILRLLRKLCEKHGVPLEGDPDIAALEQATQPENLVHQIERIARTPKRHFS